MYNNNIYIIGNLITKHRYEISIHKIKSRKGKIYEKIQNIIFSFVFTFCMTYFSIRLILNSFIAHYYLIKSVSLFNLLFKTRLENQSLS